MGPTYGRRGLMPSSRGRFIIVCGLISGGYMKIEINLKMATNVSILKFMSRINFMLS